MLRWYLSHLLLHLGNNDATVHFGDGLGCLFGRGEADETEAFAAAFFDHDLGGGDGAERLELFAEALVVDGVVQVLDEKVHALRIKRRLE